MSLYKAIAHGKEHRKPYKFSRTRRSESRLNRGDRTFSDRRRRVAAEMDIREVYRQS